MVVCSATTCCRESDDVLYTKAVPIANAVMGVGSFDLLLSNLYTPWRAGTERRGRPLLILPMAWSSPEGAAGIMMIVADNLHVMQPVFAGALERLDPEPVRELVSDCLKRGAEALDLNPGPLPRRPEERMVFLIETVQAMTDVPLVLDTVNADAMAAGLEVCRGRCIINGFSLEPAKLDRLLPLAGQYDADLIGYLLDPSSRVPADEAEMMAVAVDLFGAYTEAGLDPSRLIIDPVVAPLAWQDGGRHNRAVLTVIGALSDLLGVPVRTIAGISNLASGPVPVTRKIELERVFLPMLAAAGLDMALINVQHTATVETVSVCNGLLGEQSFAWAARSSPT